ncbi:MAG: Ig-like domain-containing protein, partial [Gemmatimonadaceae bacterium]
MLPTSRSLLRVLIPLAFATTISCGGGGGDSPTTPTPVTVATVELNASTVDLAPTTSSQLVATARSSSGAVLPNRSFSWAVVSPAVATVSTSGLVTGVADGTTTVTVTSEGRSTAATINVRTPVAAVVITPNTSQLTMGAAASQLTAEARAANGATLTGRAITWASTNTAIATVAQTGAGTAVAVGTTTISATSEGKIGTAAVTVLAPDPCATVRAIAIGQTFSGALAAADCRLPSDNTAMQSFTFTLATETVLEIEMTSTAVDAYLFVGDGAGNIVVEDDDGGTGSNARVLRSFPAGKYFVLANAYFANSFGAYQLSVKLAPTACSTGRAVAIPSSTNAALSTANSCKLNDKSFLDRYELNLNARSTVRMDMISSVVDSYLLLLDNNGKLVAQDDDAGAGVNAHIEVQLEAGHYFLLANAGIGQVGNYRLDVEVPVDPCAVTKTININTTITNTLTSADCTVGGTGPIPNTQRWLLNVATAGPIQIDMLSSAVDAYLVLQNATTGAVLAENDDAAIGTTDARIAANFPVGQYIINATTYDFNETGAYALTVAAIVTSTPVSVVAAPSTVALSAGGQQQLSATVSGSSNTNVTWTTSSSGTATVTTTGLVRGITPGTATVTARSVADPSKFSNVTVTVTQNAGTTPNLDIGAMYLIQSVQ